MKLQAASLAVLALVRGAKVKTSPGAWVCFGEQQELYLESPVATSHKMVGHYTLK